MMESKGPHLAGIAVADVDIDDEWLNKDQTTTERPPASRASWSEKELAPLFEEHEAEQFRANWLEIQSRFVDDPNASVRDADELVSQMIENIATAFADKQRSLESQWKKGAEVSTEGLRVVLKRYRSLFNRVLSLGS